MADFRLTDTGEIELNEFGEETTDFIRSHCYPELEAVLSSGAINSDPGAYSPAEEEQIRKAVQRERTWLRGKLPKDPDAKTELGKHLQASMRLSGPVADHYVESTARSVLKSKEGEGGKPN